MNTSKLEKKLKRICKNVTSGVYARNTLPRTMTYSAMYIVNMAPNRSNQSDPIELPGRHWIAIYLESEDYGEYFDSYGQELDLDFIAHMNGRCKKWLFNSKQLRARGNFHWQVM